MQMILDGKAATAITAEELQSLIDSAVPEGQHLDYKQQLPAARDARAAEEFRLDVASFANADGGYLIHGVAEQERRPTALIGVPLLDIEAEIRRLHTLLQADLEPRVPGITIGAIPLSTGTHCIVVHIPRSWQRPHWVRGHQLREWVRFVARHDADKLTLDYRQVQRLTLGTAAAVERVQQFRAERLGRIFTGDTPVALSPHPKVVLHLVPYDAFDSAGRLSASTLAADEYRDVLVPPGAQSWSRRVNFDGYLSFQQAPGGEWQAARYLQVFRDGCLEAADAIMLRPRDEFGRGIPERFLADQLIDAVGRYLPFLRSVGIAPPYSVMLSLLGVRGYVLRLQSYILGPEQHSLERDEYLFQPVLAEDAAVDPALLLRPVFDALWNAVGVLQCPHYDPQSGAWAPRI